ncbi:MAG: phosphonate C-P lyase system protein PhnG, partial [Trueperaceae bacterium]|nr:phosphonate C-P lyase system protein PhnG [Trueperaceae bacterium]
MYPQHLDQSQILSTLSQAPADSTKAFVETLLPELGEIKVLKNRTGLAMLPYRDSAKGELFHLGEVLLSEAHVQLLGFNSEGYAACLGRDLEQALALAIIDASLSARLQLTAIEAFI